MSAKILIVDDDPELLRLIGVALRRAGYEPLAAQTADDALRKVRDLQPELVILDVMLPGASGIDLCRQLRSQAATAVLPIIMLSARAQVDDKIEGLEAGADDYLTKPINPKEMVARVASLLDRTRRLRDAGRPSRGTVISILGAKGGVGVTTVALNLAIAIAQKGSRVIAAELHSHFGTFSVQLGQEPPETLAELAAISPSRIDERSVKPHLIPDASGIEVLYGPVDSGIRLQLEQEQAEAIVGVLARMADVVVLDLPNDLSPAVEAALRLSDHIFLVTRPEGDSLAAGRKVLDLIKNWGVGRGVVDAVVVNHVPLAIGLNVPSAEAQLECKIVSIVPPAADACALVHKRGRPLLITQPNNAAGAKLTELSSYISAQETA